MISLNRLELDSFSLYLFETDKFVKSYMYPLKIPTSTLKKLEINIEQMNHIDMSVKN